MALTMPSPRDPAHRVRMRIELLLLAAIVATTAFLAERRMVLPDIFEDGFHHWWIGAQYAETGTYVDPMSLMTRGNWLPGFYPLVAGLYRVASWGALDLLRWVSLGATLITLILVYTMGRRHGVLTALAGSLLFGTAIQTSLIGSMAVPESLTVLLTTAGVYLLGPPRWSREPLRLGLAAAFLLVATTLRYEAWVAVVFLPVHAWFLDRPNARSRMVVALPAVAFMGLWTASLLPGGFLPTLVLGQTAREAQNQISLGAVPATPWDRFGWFWFGNYGVGLLPLFLLGPAFMVVRLRREYPTWLALVLFTGVSLLVIGGYGTGSYRYVALAVPFVAVAAGRAVDGLVHLLRRSVRPEVSRVAIGVLVVGLVIGSAANTAWITARLDAVGVLNVPLERAGLWISRQPWTPGLRLLSDSPIATYYSHVDPSLAWSSWWLPANRSDAQAVLQEQYEYIVFVNVSYYPLARLFPELARGSSTADFTLVYDANGWEREYGAKAVYVYRPVVP